MTVRVLFWFVVQYYGIPEMQNLKQIHTKIQTPQLQSLLTIDLF